MILVVQSLVQLLIKVILFFSGVDRVLVLDKKFKWNGRVSWCFVNAYRNINAADSVVKSFSNVINTEMHEANAVLQG
jgi:hypothetical protein